MMPVWRAICRFGGRMRAWALGNVVIVAALCVVLLPLVLLCLPVLIPYLMYTGRRDRRRKLACAEVALCQRCGAVLGLAALTLADEQYAVIAAEQAAARDGLMVRYRARLAPRELDAVCTVCGQAHRYGEKTVRFEALEEDQADQAEVAAIER